MRANKLVIGDPDSGLTPSPDTDGIIRFKGIGTEPSGWNDTEAGSLYYSTSDDEFKYHDGTAWKGMGGDSGEDNYCYTYYSTSLVSCDCPPGETNKKDLGLWGYCWNLRPDEVGSYAILRSPGLICDEVWPFGNPTNPAYSGDSGLACVCCGE